MPLPFILGTAAIVAGFTGTVAAKKKEAKDISESAQRLHEINIERLKMTREETECAMDEVGKLELDILNSFEAFSDTLEKIQSRPEFKEYSIERFNCYRLW